MFWLRRKSTPFNTTKVLKLETEYTRDKCLRRWHYLSVNLHELYYHSCLLRIHPLSDVRRSSNTLSKRNVPWYLIGASKWTAFRARLEIVARLLIRRNAFRIVRSVTWELTLAFPLVIPPPRAPFMLAVHSSCFTESLSLFRRGLVVGIVVFVWYVTIISIQT